MFHMKYIFYCILLHFINATPQFNLYYTDLKNKSNNALQYNCLRTITFIDEDDIDSWRRNYTNLKINAKNHQIMSYCMNEFSSKYHVQEKINHFPNFTFYELSKQGISSEQLYLWSAPIDLIEKYQFYLNQLLTLNDLSLGKKIFHNCTLPRFGSHCQYEFDYYDHSNHSSLSEIINEYYTTNEYDPTSLTCYKHLQCYRGSESACLDWSDICDGKIDCFDHGQDEEHCWQLEINECKDNEHRCDNGQCIPDTFYQDGKIIFDCIDRSDETLVDPQVAIKHLCNKREPTSECEDRVCKGGFLTSSCVTQRKDLLMKAMFSTKHNSTSEQCWFGIKCMFDRSSSKESSCHELYGNGSHLKTLLDTCPEMLYVPNYPILFGDVYIAVEKNYSKQTLDYNGFHLYRCYKHHSHYDPFLNITTDTLFNNTICSKGDIFVSIVYGVGSASIDKYKGFIDTMHTKLKKYRYSINYTSTICNRPNMYQCMNSSKCISVRYMFDSYTASCPRSDDRDMDAVKKYPNIIEQLNKTHIYCERLNKYFSQRFINDGRCDCQDFQISSWCADEDLGEVDIRKVILFSNICDGFQELLPINGSETDETECKEWECDNIYTHCDGNWNCPNGADEIGCDELSRSMCSLNNHLCVSPSTYRFTCLHISKVNDGNIDCIGGTDEPRRQHSPVQQNYLLRYSNNFLCMNQTKSPAMHSSMLCDGQPMCDHKDDEMFCETNVATFNVRGICLSGNIGYATQVEKFLCVFVSDKYKRRIIYLKLDNSISPVEKINENVVSSSLSPMKISSKISLRLQFRCHRGLSLRVWSNNKSGLITNPVCFCPPSYYGDDCQYQNQRISLAIKFRAPSDSWRTQFAIIISLIDDGDDRVIHSYEQITYLSWNNCYTKFQMYLLYSTRSKNLTKNYSIHIDIYEIKTLAHRGSLLLPILFPFLPVHRLAFIVNIPRTINTENQICAKQSCIHGECVKYANIPEKSFCRCHERWSGRYCTIQHTCTCSFGSLCIGITANNRSICVCPLNKFGPRCLLTDTICQINNQNICKNGGECTAINRHIIFNKEFVCVCPTGYSGDRCNITDNELNLSFNKDIILPQEIFFHFIEASGNATHKRSTTFRKIPIKEDLISITWPNQFHIVFIELNKTKLDKKYYLVMYQKTYTQSKVTKKIINPSDHCPHINEIFKENFNGTFPQWHLIHRIKYYHIPCQNQSLNLSCFYDTDQFCLCYQFGQKRLANCFSFDHNMKFDCQGQSECDHGQCFEDEQECPTRSICMCDLCYFGQRCHLTTDGYGLSLDVILGYQISPHVSINYQPLIIKISLALTIIFIITGLINGILSLITFMNKTLWQVGCGLYLLTSSITTLFITIMFGLKFFILLLSHMSIISNRSFLSGQCYSFDYILRMFVSIDQWLNACIAIERTTAVIKGVSFDKNKSKKTAKLMITILFITVAVSYIHDPIHRHIIDEVNQDDSRQNRIWCIMKYSSNLKTYNSFIHTFHFISPFIITLISTITLIVVKTRQQANLHKKQTYKQTLYKTIKEHKNLLTAPIVLVFLGVPRIILIFTTNCMKSPSDGWLLLLGYFISFIPPMLIFLIYILPSTVYRNTFHNTVKQYTTNILRWFGLIQ